MTIYGQVIIICLKREEAGKRKVSSKKNGHTCFVDMSDLLTVGNTLQNGAFHNQFTVKWTKKGFLLPSKCLIRKKVDLVLHPHQIEAYPIPFLYQLAASSIDLFILKSLIWIVIYKCKCQFLVNF